MKLTTEIKQLINSIVVEFARTRRLFDKSPQDYFVEVQEAGLIFSCIDPTPDMKTAISAAIQNNEPRVYQLYKSALTEKCTQKLAKLIIKKNNFHCYSSEIGREIELFFLELVNTNILAFTTCILDKTEGFKNNEHELSDLLNATIKQIQQQKIAKRTFAFPFVMLGLKEDLSLSDNILITLVKDEILDSKEQELYLFDRHIKYNVMIKITLDAKTSERFGYHLAKNTSILISNIINIYAQFSGDDILPCTASEVQMVNIFDFYQHATKGRELSNNTTRRFQYNATKCEQFWSLFIKHIEANSEEFSKVMEIPVLSLVPSNKQRVGDLLIKSILWYGDAYLDCNSESRTVKAVTAIECLVNFGKEEDITEKFIKRVKAINHLNKDLFGNLDDQAHNIYKARSTFVHGSNLNDDLSFCPLTFSRNTILSAIPHFINYGLGQTEFKSKLPDYIDNLAM